MTGKRALKRGEEGENKVASVLDSDTSFHRLINNLVLMGQNAVSHQIDHILIRENGIFVIETKNYYGEITGEEDDVVDTFGYLLTDILKEDILKYLRPLINNSEN